MLIDSHAHIDFGEFDSDRDDAVRRAWLADVRTIVDPGIDGETTEGAARIAEEYPHIWFAAGWHPNYADSFDADLLNRYASHPKCVAIGEIGLDFYRDRTAKRLQDSVFRAQLEIARGKDLPAIIHIRDAWPEARNILDDFPDVRCDFHAFSGDDGDLDWVLERGDFVGVGGPVTFKNFKRQRSIEKTPLRNLLTETDCPFLAPHPHRGKRNEPANIPAIAEKIAELKGIPLGEIEEAVEANAHRLFDIPLPKGAARPLSPKGFLSQNFLIDKNIAAKIASLAGRGKLCIEIGAGNGELSEDLARSFDRLWAFEPDWDRHSRLREVAPKAIVLPKKAQLVDLRSLCRYEKRRGVLVGNLPYGDTSPILFHILENRDCIEQAIFMVQKEFANRLCAGSGSREYGIPSVLFSLFFDLKKEFDVPPSCFRPSPKVDSTVISLRPLIDPPADGTDFRAIERVVKSAFSHRRKTILNSMKGLFGHIDIEAAIRAANIDPSTRAERVSPESFLELARIVEAEEGAVR